MKKFDFDEIVSRSGTNCYKWDSVKRNNLIPMWVADMEFKAAPFILDALRQRVEHGVFGYTCVPDEYYQSMSNWFFNRHGFAIEQQWVSYTIGVVPAISAVLKSVTMPGDKVLIQTPVYNCFFSCIRNSGCEAACNELVYDGSTYSIDFDDLELKASDPRTTAMILCNPHNPTGRVWTRQELERIADICKSNNVFVISDEIHCEIVMPGYEYTPFLTLPAEYHDGCAVCLSPSKAFNIAGLQIANIVAPNAIRHERIERAININEVCDVNPFGVEALMAAYTPEGAEWIDELNAYLYDNYQCLCEFFENNLPQFSVTKLEGTYLVWVDCSVLGKPSNELADELLQAQGLYVNAGAMYGVAGTDFLRFNIACPRAMMLEGLKRFKAYVEC